MSAALVLVFIFLCHYRCRCVTFNNTLLIRPFMTIFARLFVSCIFDTARECKFGGLLTPRPSQTWEESHMGTITCHTGGTTGPWALSCC